MSRTEEWIRIKQFPSHAVNIVGEVLNIGTNRTVAAREVDGGKLRVSLYDRGHRRDFMVHQLVYQAWWGGDLEDESLHVMHLDGNVQNNHAENLRHTRRERKYAEEHRPIRDDETPNSRYWGRRVVIVETDELFESVRQCADYIKGDFGSIYKCLEGKRRTHKGYTYAWWDDR